MWGRAVGGMEMCRVLSRALAMPGAPRVIVIVALVLASLVLLPALVRGTQFDRDYDQDRRLTAVEVATARLESRLDSLESVGQGILIVVVAQLLLSGLALRQRNTKGDR